MKKICRALAVLALAAVPLVVTAVPAMASVRRPFVVIVNGSADVTLAHLTAGQEVYHGGLAYKVVTVSGHAVVFAPRWTAPDGTAGVFST